MNVLLRANTLVSISPAQVYHAAHLRQGRIDDFPPIPTQPLKSSISTLTSVPLHGRGDVGLIANKKSSPSFFCETSLDLRITTDIDPQYGYSFWMRLFCFSQSSACRSIWSLARSASWHSPLRPFWRSSQDGSSRASAARLVPISV